MEARRMRRGRSLKERLRFKGGLSCCGSSWGFGPPDHMSVADEGEGADRVVIETAAAETREEEEDQIGNASNDGEIPRTSGSISAAEMNLATALAAERHLRATETAVVVESPLKVSLMRLLEEGGEQTGGGGIGISGCCCVCMGRRKGAAFIPCGHTFCRVCSRELWLNRGSCPLCNRHILDILDIF